MKNLLIKIRKMPLNIKTLIRANLLIWGLLAVAFFIPLNEFMDILINMQIERGIEWNVVALTISFYVIFALVFLMMIFAQIWSYKILCKKIKKREKEIWVTGVTIGLYALISSIFSLIIPWLYNAYWIIYILSLPILTFLMSKYIFKLDVSIRDWKYFGTVLLQYVLGWVLFFTIALALAFVAGLFRIIFT